MQLFLRISKKCQGFNFDFTNGRSLTVSGVLFRAIEHLAHIDILLVVFCFQDKTWSNHISSLYIHVYTFPNDWLVYG